MIDRVQTFVGSVTIATEAANKLFGGVEPAIFRNYVNSRRDKFSIPSNKNLSDFILSKFSRVIVRQSSPH
jgi:hypothetical protein